MGSFEGFPKDAYVFLKELQDNNNREWFEPQKERYEASVREPALEFIRAMAHPLADIAPHFEAVAKKTGGSLMRPYRDIRFSPDKTPYKTNIGIHFRHQARKNVHAPGFYVHIEPDSCFIGVGLWRPESGPLRDIRQAIADSADEFASIISEPSFASAFAREGEALKKSVITKPEFLPSVVESFQIASPYVEFLCGALGVEL